MCRVGDQHVESNITQALSHTVRPGPPQGRAVRLGAGSNVATAVYDSLTVATASLTVAAGRAGPDRDPIRLVLGTVPALLLPESVSRLPVPAFACCAGAAPSRRPAPDTGCARGSWTAALATFVGLFPVPACHIDPGGLAQGRDAASGQESARDTVTKQDLGSQLDVATQDKPLDASSDLPSDPVSTCPGGCPSGSICCATTSGGKPSCHGSALGCLCDASPLLCGTSLVCCALALGEPSICRSSPGLCVCEGKPMLCGADYVCCAQSVGAPPICRSSPALCLCESDAAICGSSHTCCSKGSGPKTCRSSC